ncbi:MAG: polyphenol oxidase family protein [Actinomycetota bacterium]|nr:polyphenol oxidase family protein [Actinomycetota bacterium]
MQAPFRWQGDHVAADLPGAQVLFTTRRGGGSRPPFATLNLGPWTDDEPASVARNQATLAGLAGLAPESLALGHQVHGTVVARVTSDPAGAVAEGVDGHATALPGVAPVVLVADCLPVALAADGAVAMLHAGWRGLAGGILAEGVAAVRELGGRGPLHAAIGPGAGGCCYEVGDEVRAHFAGEHADGRRLDLKAGARAQLEAAGVAAVHDTGLCTLCADPALFFSHRRDGGRTGRQAGITWRSSSPA